MIERRTFMGSLVAMVGGLVLPPTPALVLPGADYRRQTFRIGFGKASIKNVSVGSTYKLLRAGLDQIPTDGLLRLLDQLKDPDSPLIFDGSIATEDGW